MADGGAPEAESVAVALARMEGKIDTNFTAIRGDLHAQSLITQGAVTATNDHEARLRSLEQTTPSQEDVSLLQAQIQELKAALADLNKWRWKTAGAMAAVSALAAFVATIAASYLTR